MLGCNDIYERSQAAQVQLAWDSGGLYLDTPDARELVAAALQETETPAKGSDERPTDREKEVLKLIVEGMTSKLIADALSVSIKTVVTHRTNLMDKLGLHNRVELIKFGIRHGLVPTSHESE